MKLLLPLLFFLSIFLASCHAQIQPSYEANNPQFNCYSSNGSTTLGYTCDAAQRSCPTYLTFRSQTDHQTPSQIASLLNSDPSSISQLNTIPLNFSIPIDELVIIPTTCSCGGGNYYQHNASYIIQGTGETYLTIANDTYQGLSTCQALIAQNPYDSRSLVAGMKILVPLRCACPTTDQITKMGVKYLLTYFVTWGDDVHAIAQRLNSDYTSVLSANGLSQSDVIYPFTTLLIPIKTEPTKAQVQSLQPPPSSPPKPPASGGSNTTWVYVGVGSGAGFLILCGILSWYFCCFHRRPHTEESAIKQGEKVELFVIITGKNMW